MLSLPTTLSTLIFLLTTLSPTHAQQVADGTIVPFTSILPACASKCGPLYDVQGACTDPAAYNSCFCADARLTTFNTGGTAAVSSVCGATSCTTAEDLEKVRSWYSSYCSTKQVSSTAGGAAATGTSTAGSSGSTSGSSSGSSSSNSGSTANSGGGSWLSTHYKWVIMLVILVVVIVGGWIGACIWRKAYIRKREREFELRPPAAPFAPSQEHNIPGLQNKGTPSGIQRVYGPGVGMGGAPGAAGGHLKEMRSASTVATGPPVMRGAGGDVEKGGEEGVVD